MIRANDHDNSSTLPLFPFVAVLLCTMGALLILLVAVARSSRYQGLQQAAVRKAAADAPAVEDPNRQKLEEVRQYVGMLNLTRAAAAENLRDDQLRLSHLEEHMRRLQDQLDSLRVAAVELNSMEKEHYDDREQAEREVVRLQQLIAESKETIEQLRSDMRSKRKSYSVVPYEGRNGTHRRPIYIECRKDGVILQPEGIQLTPNDFAPPIGPGNPLAAALRAAREYIVREEPVSGTGKEAEPYPLILVRPDGILAYYHVREAIESWDADFGYELVDADWNLQFPPANPQMQMVEAQAVTLSRGRAQALAVAAPRAYGTRRGGSSTFDDIDDDETPGDGFGGGRGGGVNGIAGSFSTYEGGGADGASESTVLASGTSQNGSGGSGTGAGAAGGSNGDNTSKLANGNRPNGGAGGTGNGAGAITAGGQDGNISHAVDRQNGAMQNSTADGGMPGGQREVGGTIGAPPDELAAKERDAKGAVAADEYEKKPTVVGPNALTPHPQIRHTDALPPRTADDDELSERDKAPKAHGKNWAILNPQPDSVPIRRTIRVVVRADQLAILPEPGAGPDGPAGGAEFPMTGPTDQAMDRFVTALERHVKTWGMAGQGLYWRPVLELSVGPDGQQRAAELVRMLKNSGIEVRGASVAENNKGDDTRASR